MRTLGLDMASQPKETALCWIDWDEKHATASAPITHCTDERIDEEIADAQAVGVDAPFGWPLPFIDGVSNWTHLHWNNVVRDSLRLRETDREIKDKTKLTPLSVSSDRIALPAMRTMALLRRHGVVDNSGDNRFYEVYPAATLKQWGFPCNRYKGKDAAHNECRRKILAALKGALPALQVSDAYADSDHALDALVAALTARAAVIGKTLRPSESQRLTAQREGWIHITVDEAPTNLASLLWP
jgi:predicted nuclease with RNAse H fold